MRITLLILVFILFVAAIYGESSDSSRSEFFNLYYLATEHQNSSVHALFDLMNSWCSLVST